MKPIYHASNSTIGKGIKNVSKMAEKFLWYWSQLVVIIKIQKPEDKKVLIVESGARIHTTRWATMPITITTHPYPPVMA